jgi:hypothetical protein
MSPIYKGIGCTVVGVLSLHVEVMAADISLASYTCSVAQFKSTAARAANASNV